jgi:hypothetical protein
MDDRMLQLADLEKLCDERTEESLTLEFKPCAELIVGSEFYDKSGMVRKRTRDDVLDKLTRDVTAMLNAAGGRIIYGIREKNSRADHLDAGDSFCPAPKEHNIFPEKVTDWLRAHAQPSPSVHPYRIFENTSNEHSPWYLVIEIPQGEQAYMARDHKFYKRVGATAQPMEQYEVVDVMNRVRGAALALRTDLRRQPEQTHRPGWLRVLIDIEVTSVNYVASEYGAIKLTAGYPMQLDRGANLFGAIRNPMRVGLHIKGEERTAWAEESMASWGASTGTVIFPGHWHNFHGHPLIMHIPILGDMRDPTFLIRMELFTLNSIHKMFLFAIRREDHESNFAMVRVVATNRDNLLEAFWRTYHKAQEQLQREH